MASRILRSLVVILFFVGVSLADDRKYPRITVHPDLNGGLPKVLNEGESVSFTCIFEADENDQYTKADRLYWRNNYDTEIGTDPSQAVYTKQLSGKHLRMLLLIVKGDTANNEMPYVCGAEYNGESLTRKSVKVVVLRPPTWTDTAEEVVGKIGEEVKIDCQTKPSAGGKHVDTVFSFQNNTNVPVNESDPASRYRLMTPSRTTLIISPLTMAERDVVIRCTALESHQQQSVILRTDKTIKINLHFPPKFAVHSTRSADSDLTVTAVLGGEVKLPCHVTDSNPPVASFEFFAGHEATQLSDGPKYKIEQDITGQMATLTVSNLEQEDFDISYYCDAETEGGNSRNRMTFKLQQLFLPDKPEVACSGMSENSLQFNITEIDSAPINGYEFRLVQFETIKGLNESQKKEAFANAVAKFLNKSDTNVYVLDNLHQGTTYTVEIKAVNQAGQSAPFECNATTLGVASSAPIALQRSWSVTIAVLVLWMFWAMRK